MAGATLLVCQNVNLSPGLETQASPFPTHPPSTITDTLLPQLLIGTPHHHLQPIRKHPPTVILLLERVQQAVFLPIASVRMPMNLCCCWRLGLRTCCLVAYDYHGRFTCQLRWPTTSVMTSTVVKLLQCRCILISLFVVVYVINYHILHCFQVYANTNYFNTNVENVFHFDLVWLFTNIPILKNSTVEC